ncbi:hypothetical protein DT075_09270 [Bacillus licheniformis]|nr:hypothetical protein DT075_09270 [Bacillus licheniformis]
MITISNKLKSICDIYTEGVQKEIKNLSESDFYKAGQASKAIESYADILGKTMEPAKTGRPRLPDDNTLLYKRRRLHLG